LISKAVVDGISGAKRSKKMKNVKVVTSIKSYLLSVIVKKWLTVPNSVNKKIGDSMNHDALTL